jgi:hypothetical protein
MDSPNTNFSSRFPEWDLATPVFPAKKKFAIESIPVKNPVDLKNNNPIPGKAGPRMKTTSRMVLVLRASYADVSAKKAKKASKRANKHVYKTPEKGGGG